MKIFILTLFVVLYCSAGYGQNLIGLDDKEILKYAKENLKDFNLQNDNNNSFKYLKYTDNLNLQTILFFLSDKYVCTEVRMICDLSMKNQKVNELDSIYSKTGNNIWTEKKNNSIYLIELVNENWFFSINIKTKE
jgi:hypothetical protein